ncbi:MAG TPA: glycosyltransferase [Gaiellaceae bacterium]|nr:glycosyltransferase [Gaiellaceae bacterium]
MAAPFPSTTIVGSADEAYAAPACVALLSAATAVPEPLPCLFLDCGCSEQTLARMRRAFERWSVPLRIEPVEEALADLHTEAYVSRATYGSLLAAGLVGDHSERTLFLDCDTVTLGNIAPLLASELHGRTIGAVQDARLRYVSGEMGVPDWRERGLPPALAYFNAGVLLIDNLRWREQEVADRALELLRDRPGAFPIVEQGVLNAILAGDWWPLDRRWNHAPAPALAIRVGERLLTRRTMEQFAPPAIVHFVDRFKPWHDDYPSSYFRRAYVQAAARFATEFPQPPRWNALRWAASRRRMMRAWRA